MQQQWEEWMTCCCFCSKTKPFIDCIFKNVYISYVDPEFLYYSEVAMKYSALTLFSAPYVIVCVYAKI